MRGAGEILAWSRILDDQEAVCIVNTHGSESRGADIIVDASLNGGGHLTVVANSAEAAGASTSMPVGSEVPVRRNGVGAAFVEVRDLPPSEVLVFVNRP